MVHIGILTPQEFSNLPTVPKRRKCITAILRKNSLPKLLGSRKMLNKTALNHLPAWSTLLHNLLAKEHNFLQPGKKRAKEMQEATKKRLPTIVTNWKGRFASPRRGKNGRKSKSKLFVKGSEQQYGMLLETRPNPDIVLDEKDMEPGMFHDCPSSYLFVKIFQK